MDPFAAAGHSGHPDCRLEKASGDEDFELPQAELERIARLKSESRQRDLRGSLIVRRQLISGIAACDPRDVSLGANDDGAPVLASPAGWSVSIANKGDLTAVALRPSPSEIGVDLEIVRDIKWLPILAMLCTDVSRRSSECNLISHTDPLRAFYRMWTLKEAILKATSLGFRAGPKAIETPFEVIASPGTGEIAAFGKAYRFWTIDVDDAVVSLVERCG